MVRSSIICCLSLLVGSGVCWSGDASSRPLRVYLCCSAENDLHQVLKDSGYECVRFETLAGALDEVPDKAPLLVLADGYPETTTRITTAQFEQARKKKLRLYLEYPAWLPGLEVAAPRRFKIERAVVTSDFFGSNLKPLRIMAINGKHVTPVDVAESHVVAARVAGFDSAVYGLPDETSPLLFEHPAGDVLVATTKLSHFVTGRYSPTDAIQTMWNGILRWLCGDGPMPELRWTATVRPSYGRDDVLPRDIEKQTIERAGRWYYRSKVMPTAEQDQAVKRAMTKADGPMLPPAPDEPVGDGSFGILQGYMSGIALDGTQMRNAVRRGDNQCEAAMTLALIGKVEGDQRKLQAARNILDFYLFDSEARRGPRADPNHGAYGLIAWGIDHPAWLKANYGDDNARQIMGILATAAATQSDRWNEAVGMCLLANIRTTGVLGFRPDRIDVGPLTKNGWEPYFRAKTVRLVPHFEAYLWACFLWAYQHTGDELFYTRTEKAIRMTMESYPDNWTWTNGMAQELARMLLPLAWLVRVEDTPEHRRWLRRVATDLIALQQRCGAIAEQLGRPGKGIYPPPPSNEAYGGNEASLIQRNGDPVSDLLYTTNFAFLALHEAAAATGETLYRDAEDKLAEFLCRIQVRSSAHPEMDGTWFRAFDFQRWEHWGSDADAGWGAWCTMTGWIHSWITSVLAMRQMDTSLWDLTSDIRMEPAHRMYRPTMIPDEFPNSIDTLESSVPR